MVTGELEAVGDAVTGTIIARAVEPDSTSASRAGHGVCLNCGAMLVGAHCHNCGQKAKVHRTLRAYGHDLLHGVFHFEGKVWKTLPMLAFRPGELTRRYIHGERAKFVSPLALFLFAVFLSFAVMSGLAGGFSAPENDATIELIATAKSDISKAESQVKAERIEIDAQIAAAEKAGTDTTALEKKASDLRDFQQGMAISKRIKAGPAGDAIEGLKTGWPQLDAAVEKANKNPNLLIYKLQTGAYKYSWALIPLSVPFVWLLFFWRRRFKIYDHAVFVTYSLAFMLFVVILLTAVDAAGVPDPVVPVAAVAIPPVHIYRQLRGAYDIGRGSALARTLALIIFGSIVLLVFLLLLLLLGIMG